MRLSILFDVLSVSLPARARSPDSPRPSRLTVISYFFLEKSVFAITFVEIIEGKCNFFHRLQFFPCRKSDSLQQPRETPVPFQLESAAAVVVVAVTAVFAAAATALAVVAVFAAAVAVVDFYSLRFFSRIDGILKGQ